MTGGRSLELGAGSDIQKPHVGRFLESWIMGLKARKNMSEDSVSLEDSSTDVELGSSQLLCFYVS